MHQVRDILTDKIKQAGAELCQAQVRLSQLLTCLDVAVELARAEHLEKFDLIYFFGWLGGWVGGRVGGWPGGWPGGWRKWN